MNSRQWKVGKTQATTPPENHSKLDVAFSFSIQDRHSAPLVTISYHTEAEAKHFEAVVREAIEFAIDVSTQK